MKNGYIENPKCNYGGCKEEAVTTGYIVLRSGRKQPVNACLEHKDLPSFFEGEVKK